MEVRYLDVELMERMCHRLAVAFFDTKEDPIPPFRNHTKSLLESSLNLPKATYNGKELYPTLIEKATILYYTLNKNHPFGNGNKRIATASLLIFLFINDQWLDTGITEMVEEALYVAESKPTDKDVILNNIRDWIKAHIIKAEKSFAFDR